MKTTIIHHKDNDGYLSAYLMVEILQQIEPDLSFILIEYNYELNPTADWFNIKDDGIKEKFIFVDITPPMEWLNKINNFCNITTKMVEIYDHHESKCLPIINRNFIFVNIEYNSKMCSAKIIFNNFWNVFYEKFLHDNNNKFLLLTKIVEIINYYDLWLFKKEKPINIIKDYYILPINIAFQKSDSYIKFVIDINTIFDEKNFSKFIDIGREKINEIKNKNNKMITNGKLNKKNVFIYEGYPNYWLCEELFKNKEIKYILGFEINLNLDKIKFSLRSDKENNCDKIAAQWKNGGGHKNASGFETNLTNGLNIISDNDFVLNKLDKNNSDKSEIKQLTTKYSSVKKYF